MTTTALTGSPAQVEWAARIRAQLARRLGWNSLPDIDAARFWIDNRECDTQAELAQAASDYQLEQDVAYESPFTEVFPRHTREDALPVLRALRRMSETVGVVVADLETTGLETTDRIAEIAAVRWPSREVVIDTVVRLPEGLKPAEITAITAEEVAAAEPFEALADDLGIHLAYRHLVTWNVRFDARFLHRELRLSGQRHRLRATCAMRLAGAWLELAGWPSLEEAAAAFGVEIAGPAHRAMPDVLTTCALLDAMAAGGRP